MADPGGGLGGQPVFLTSLSLSLSEVENCRNCIIFGAQGDHGRPFDFSTFDLGVTSRDLL